MTRPNDIPEGVWNAASEAISGSEGSSQTWGDIYERIARAILAERERCAKIADEREAICADAVAKIEAGELYPNIPTARATEDCARMEAGHIARLIRGVATAIRSGA